MISYRKIVLLFSLLIVGMTSYSQSNETIIINNGAFENPEFQKFFSIEITKAYMLDYQISKGLSDAQKVGLAKFFKIEQEELEVDDFVKSYGTVLKSNDWESAEGVLKESFQLINNYLDSSFLNESAINVCETAGNARDLIFPLLASSASYYIMDIEDVNSEPNNNGENVGDEVQEPSSFVWVYWIIIGLCIIAILILFRLNSVLRDELSTKENDHKDEIEKLGKEQNNTNSKKEDKIEKLEKLNNQLKDSKQSLGASALRTNIENQANQASQEVQKGDHVEVVTPVPIIKNEPKESFIFLPSPKAECKFNADEGSPFIKDRSLYVIALEGDSSRGMLSIADNIAMYEVAFNSPDIYIEKACEFENAYERHHKSISTITKGIVIKDGSDWIVEKKVLIKFV